MRDRNVLREKILKGVKLAIKKLIAVSQQNDDYLVFYQNGKIVKIKARKLKQS